ncbi:MAG: hypothetical protein AAGA60_09600 [Cyanobacteria bacterium P01_E01_bin.42]
MSRNVLDLQTLFADFRAKSDRAIVEGERISDRLAKTERLP